MPPPSLKERLVAPALAATAGTLDSVPGGCKMAPGCLGKEARKLIAATSGGAAPAPIPMPPIPMPPETVAASSETSCSSTPRLKSTKASARSPGASVMD